MRVMTFNIRFENTTDGANSWFYRREPVAEIIRRYLPAIVGTQEGRWSQLLDLEERLPEYHLYAPERVVDETCQYPTLFFLREKFIPLAGGEFWLSETPDAHRSKSWDSAFPRMLSFAKLQITGTEKIFWVGVTHLDHLGSEARRRQGVLLANWASSLNYPLILMGDFNDSPDSELHAILTRHNTRLLDTWHALGRAESEQSVTNHGFTGIPKKYRIDWILTSPEFHVKDASIIRDNFRGSYPSDHFPYLVDLEVSSQKPTPSAR